MTNEDYIKKLDRLRQIEQTVKKPEFSLDGIEPLIEETKAIVSECLAYTRTLKEKVDDLEQMMS